jgi:hypothetical protein
MSGHEKLFSGEPELLGGLSNEEELVESCPEQFKRGNPWSHLASNLFFGGGRIKHWKWKTNDPEVKKRQMGCFNGLMGTFGIGHEDKEAVAGWMLSEMLAELPDYVPPDKERVGAMKWLMVGKTVVAHGSGAPMFVLIDEAEKKPVQGYLTLEGLAAAIKATKPNPVDEEPRLIKNDLPAVAWLPDDTVPDTFLQCERLDGATLHQLVLLLRK